MVDIWTAVEIGITIGGLSVFAIFVAGSKYLQSKRPKSLKKILDDLYLNMIVGDQRTLNITIKREKRKMKLVSYRLVSELYDNVEKENKNENHNEKDKTN